jgi:lipid-A-disaccharide synthase-like uncharacterized protein
MSDNNAKDYDYLMNTASFLFLVCYIPEFYANYKNKNANIYNLPEKILLLFGSIFAFSYSLQLGDISIITNYSLALFIDIIAIVMRSYYVIINRKQNLTIAHHSLHATHDVQHATHDVQHVSHDILQISRDSPV